MRLAKTARRMVARFGETMTLRRDGEADLPLKGKRVGGTIEAVGNTDQQNFRVLIGTAELTASAWASKAPTASGDVLIVAGRVRTVLDVKPRSDGDIVALYELEVAG